MTWLVLSLLAISFYHSLIVLGQTTDKDKVNLGVVCISMLWNLSYYLVLSAVVYTALTTLGLFVTINQLLSVSILIGVTFLVLGQIVRTVRI